MWVWLSLASLSGLVGCGSEPMGAVATTEVEQIDVADLKARLEDGSVPLLVDVRTARERAGGYIPGSIHIPLSDLEARSAELTGGGPVTFVCQSGRRSQTAAQWLAKQGVKTVNVKGGTSRWMAQGYAVTKE